MATQFQNDTMSSMATASPGIPNPDKHPYDFHGEDADATSKFTKNFDKVLSFQLVLSRLSMPEKKQKAFQEFFDNYLRYQESAMPLFSSMINSLNFIYKNKLSEAFAIPILNQEVENLESVITKEIKNFDDLFKRRHSIIQMEETDERVLSNKELLDTSEEVGDSVKNAASGIISRVGNYLRRKKNYPFDVFPQGDPKKLWSERNQKAIQGVIKYSDEVINIFRRVV